MDGRKVIAVASGARSLDQQAVDGRPIFGDGPADTTARAGDEQGFAFE